MLIFVKGYLPYNRTIIHRHFFFPYHQYTPLVQGQFSIFILPLLSLSPDPPPLMPRVTFLCADWKCVCRMGVSIYHCSYNIRCFLCTPFSLKNFIPLGFLDQVFIFIKADAKFCWLFWFRFWSNPLSAFASFFLF